MRYYKKNIFILLAGLVLHQNDEYYQVAAEGGLIGIKKDDVLLINQSTKICSGDRFFTPGRYLEKAYSSRVFFNPDGQKLWIIMTLNYFGLVKFLLFYKLFEKCKTKKL